MNAILSVVAAVAMIAASAGARAAALAQERSSVLQIQVAALDSAYRLWMASGLLADRVVVMHSRPALPSLDAGDRRAPARPETRPPARDSEETAVLATAIGARPGTEAELNPCAPGRGCEFMPGLATVIVGDPVQRGDSALVTVGLSLVHEERGSFRGRATYWGVTLVRTGRGWRAVEMKIVGEG